MERQPRILVVDDHAEIRALVQRFLGDHGYRVSTAADGVGMKKVLTDAVIDLIVLDLARGRDSRAFDRAIDTLVSRLRRKLGDLPHNSQIIKTVRGGGYLFVPKVEHGDAPVV